MTIGTIDESRRRAATVVGLSYLFALPPAIFAELYVRRLIAFDNAAQTALAARIFAHAATDSYFNLQAEFAG